MKICNNVPGYNGKKNAERQSINNKWNRLLDHIFIIHR